MDYVLYQKNGNGPWTIREGTSCSGKGAVVFSDPDFHTAVTYMNELAEKHHLIVLLRTAAGGAKVYYTEPEPKRKPWQTGRTF